MASAFSRFVGRGLGKGRRLSSARGAEGAGDLVRAAQLYAEAGEPGEAARVLSLRADAEADPAKRFLILTQAVAIAPAGGEVGKAAKAKRAALAVLLAGEGPLSAARRADVLAAARDLEEAGDTRGAAAAYRRAGDAEAEARALELAGEIEPLETLLDAESARDRAHRRRTQLEREIDVLVASGRRREALALAEQRSGGAPERAAQLRGRRIMGPAVRAIVDGALVTFALGTEIVVGRTEGAIQIASNAVSRRHLAIARAGDDAVVRDLGSRNGTLLRGLALEGAARVGSGIELALGREVPVRIRPSVELPGAFVVEAAGVVYAAPLGPARLGIAAWQIAPASDGWVELIAGEGAPAYADDVELVARVSLLAGDALSSARGAPPVLRVLG